MSFGGFWWKTWFSLGKTSVFEFRTGVLDSLFRTVKSQMPMGEDTKNSGKNDMEEL